MRLLSLFSGIGAFEKALKNTGIQTEIVNYCEIDKYASKAYSAIHGVSESLNLGDIRTVNAEKLPRDIDLITYGFPCQDISNAGKRRGFWDGEGKVTRSGLFFEAARIIRYLKPEIAIAENVKALTGRKFTEEFETVRLELNEAGYNNYYAVLNAKDYGIPQNRERLFIVSVRQDADTGSFAFPVRQKLVLKLKDLLEPVTDEKYFIRNEKAKALIGKIAVKNAKGIIGSTNGHQSGNIVHEDSVISPCLTVAGHVEPLKIMRLGNLYSDNAGGSWGGNVYDPEGLAPVLQTAQGGNRTPIIYKEYAIRKLTPLEYWRLMGFEDTDFKKAKAEGISNTQLYKMAGNSICVPVLEAIFRKLYIK